MHIIYFVQLYDLLYAVTLLASLFEQDAFKYIHVAAHTLKTLVDLIFVCNEWLAFAKNPKAKESSH